MSNTRHNPNSSGAYFIFYINCKACDSVSYKLYIQSKPSVHSLVKIFIEKKGEHDPEKHLSIKPTRMIGEARTELALEVLANNKGSSTAYYNKLFLWEIYGTQLNKEAFTESVNILLVTFLG